MGKYKIYLFMYPLSLFLIAVILTVIPLVGFIFLPIGYFNVTGFLLLIAIIAFIADCIIGNVPRLLILLPVAFFGWYYSLVYEENQKIANLERDLKRSNPHDVVQFDPDNHDIISDSAEGLITKYRIPTTYKRLNFTSFEDKFWSFRMTHDRPCKRVSNYLQRGIHNKTVRLPDKDGVKRRIKNLCVFKYPQTPDRTVLEFSRQQDKKENGISITSLHLSIGGDVRHTYKTAFTKRYRPYPLFRLVCFINAGAQKWECERGFARDGYKLDTNPVSLLSDEVENPIAILLSLHRYARDELENFNGFEQNEQSLRQKLDQ
ncbi:MAG: hypothetical protein GY742_13390 [Hyphomicrobiales bacterium]|nr:hypothetical protein [Hyphomicrobiales bacterium]